VSPGRALVVAPDDGTMEVEKMTLVPGPPCIRAPVCCAAAGGMVAGAAEVGGSTRARSARIMISKAS